MRGPAYFRTRRIGGAPPVLRLSVDRTRAHGGHVRLFSPWGYNIDPAVKALLMRHGWREPCADTFPTGAELVNRYLAPLATTPEMAAVIETGARVTRITRQGADKALSRSRDARPFTLSVTQADGRPRRDLARAVIDASGTWAN